MLTEDEARTWVPVDGYYGLYLVSGAGVIFSMTRMKPYRDGRRRIKGKALSPATVRGYKRVNLWKRGTPKQFLVHVLVATAFCGPKPSPRHQINHKNGNRADNRASNLEWVTSSENLKHSYDVLGRTATDRARAAAPKGQKNGRSKLTERALISAKSRRMEGESINAIARDIGVHGSTLRRALRGETWCGLAGDPK